MRRSASTGDGAPWLVLGATCKADRMRVLRTCIQQAPLKLHRPIVPTVCRVLWTAGGLVRKRFTLDTAVLQVQLLP